METVGSSKMSLPIYLIAQHHILEVCNLNSHCHENVATQANYKQNYDGKSISKLQIVIEKKRMGIMTYKQHLTFNVISKQI